MVVRAAKELHFNKNMEALKRMQAGVDKLATVVGVTIGPKVSRTGAGSRQAAASTFRSLPAGAPKPSAQPGPLSVQVIHQRTNFVRNRCNRWLLTAWQQLTFVVMSSIVEA